MSFLETELLWSLTNQSPDSKAAGGPRLLLDGYNASRNRFARDFTLWMGIGVSQFESATRRIRFHSHATSACTGTTKTTDAGTSARTATGIHGE